MKRTISSKWTMPIKIVNFVLAMIPIVLIIAVLNTFRGSTSASFPNGLSILTMGLGLAWSVFFLWANSRLKFVEMDEDNLYVSRLLVEKSISRAEIGEVFLTKIGVVWICIRFRSPTVFGKQIFFQPTLTRSFLTSFQRFHPVVEELKSHCGQAIKA